MLQVGNTQDVWVRRKVGALRILVAVNESVQFWKYHQARSRDLRKFNRDWLGHLACFKCSESLSRWAFLINSKDNRTSTWHTREITDLARKHEISRVLLQYVPFSSENNPTQKKNKKKNI